MSASAKTPSDADLREKASADEGDFEVELLIPSSLKMVPLAVELGLSLMEIRGYADKQRSSIRMAVHETLINAIKHGSIENPQAKVLIRYSFKGDCFHTDIEDEGEGFDPNEIPDPTSPENILKTGGRGIFLAKQMTDQFAITRLPTRGVRVSFCMFQPESEKK
jgi:serine/threonine-protein kinase RsbW